MRWAPGLARQAQRSNKCRQIVTSRQHHHEAGNGRPSAVPRVVFIVFGGPTPPLLRLILIMLNHLQTVSGVSSCWIVHKARQGGTACCCSQGVRKATVRAAPHLRVCLLWPDSQPDSQRERRSQEDSPPAVHTRHFLQHDDLHGPCVGLNPTRGPTEARMPGSARRSALECVLSSLSCT